MKKTSKPTQGLKLLFADDEEPIQDTMSLELPQLGHQVTVCPDGQTALAALAEATYDCIIVDLDMPKVSGLDVIRRCKELSPDTDAIVLTGNSTIESAIGALREGVCDYLRKPTSLRELEAVLARVARKRAMAKRCEALERRLESVEGDRRLIGDSGSLQQVRERIAKVAPTHSSVLILGETGSGKELVARAVHDQSPRADQPFVAINCGALPESLIESELFGHRKGAFTGADEHRVGLFEVASGGTLFLDEIGELPKAMQAKLLRVLESREIRRVGDNESHKVDVRLVCATHRNLEEMVERGEFRDDLMYRINTFEIHLPPLRQRLADIPQLAQHLFRRFRPHAKPRDELFTPEAIAMLQSHTWPGNVRELANVIEHATIVADRLPITPEHLPRRFGARQMRLRGLGPITLRDLEMQAIHEAIERHEGNKSAAAEELGISLKTLYNKLNQAAELEKAA